jgi:hypothetical protein
VLACVHTSLHKCLTVDVISETLNCFKLLHAPCLDKLHAFRPLLQRNAQLGRMRHIATQVTFMIQCSLASYFQVAS